MAQVINTNVAALFAGAALNKSALALQTAQQRLSSGLRINSAKDDSTGLGIATLDDAKIRGANMNIRNANDGISVAQTNDGYMAQITENTQRLREIYVQTGAVSNEEATALIAENTRISGLVTADTAVTVDPSGGTAGGTGTTFTSATAYANLAAFDTELGNINTARAKFGADMASLSSAVASLQTASVNLSASYSRIMDTDYAAETTAQAKNNILQQAGTAVLAQANQTPNTVLSLLR
ncbi:MAG: flagellin [Betaproteobacteria bacterium]|nr:flagellin [Betaproteobacteria bacterium]